MAKETNKPAAVAGAKEMETWNMMQMLAFTIFGALIATLVSARYSNPVAGPHAPVHALEASNVKILSFDPFIAHISNFVSEAERKHLLELGSVRPFVPYTSTSKTNPCISPLLTSSTVAGAPSTLRTSSTAFLPPSDPVVAALALRAAAFQGFLDPLDIDVQITSYNPGQEYKHHYDWYPSATPAGKNRLSTFFAILKSSCRDCGTEFPFFNATLHSQYTSAWCDVLDCTKELLTSLNVEGSALFWINLNPDGSGRRDMYHAGLPAAGGEKVGLNIWSEIDVGEVVKRGLFGGWSRKWWRPEEEWLEAVGLA
ncbi:hypothetical protein BDU57DRAFT_458518 [Ampelomyces quisqualis]|uniref:Prolyl 4-hydroxylase alpha subunit domain-containing protein n=1 Tax=Ampelomyces quisqualis TaxID=50730 RepID=A0A6A5QCZ3_AMPQU|nr:hypothetical protein BDU57DRAFT_458518 [Ampelomyces quisqualis]